MKKIVLFIFTLFTFTLAISQDIASDLVAHYKFCGDLNDASGHNNHGEFMGISSLTFGSDHKGNSNSALLLNGLDQYVSVPSSESLDSPVEEVTVALWFNYAAAYNGWITPLTKTNIRIVADRQYGFGINENTGRAYLTTYYVGAYAFQPNTWYHAVITVTESEYHFYINGELIETGVPTDPIVQNNQPLEIGREEPVVTEFYNGLLDDIRIYARALTIDEIGLVMDADGCNSNSISENDWDLPVELYPNPVEDQVQLKFMGSGTEKNIQIFNHMGQLVFADRNSEEQINISVANQPSGIYHLIITSKEGNYSQKIIKK
jgi:hypothetical protein